MRYCGVFRRPLPGTEPSQRLKQCLEAEHNAKPMQLAPEAAP
jgi:hypothetical protein